MDAEGNVLGKQRWRSVDALDATGKKVKQSIEIKKKADGGDKVARNDLTIISTELALFEPADGRKKLAELADLSADQKKAVEAVVVNYDVADAANALPRGDKAAALELGKKFVAWKKEGRVPTWENELYRFHNHILDYAESEKDPKLFEESFDAMKARFGKSLGQRFVDAKTKVLEQLKNPR